VASAENLKLEIQGINLIVIGFAIDNQVNKILEEIAVAGGGSYLAANNSSDISKAFNDQLLVVEKDCVRTTLLKISSRYKANNLNNLNCWIDAQKKESDNFDANILEKSFDAQCNQELSDVLKARHTEFWHKIKALEEKGNETYKGVELDYNNQLKALGG